MAIRENNDVVKIDGCNGAPQAVQLSNEAINGRVRVKRENKGGYTEFRVRDIVFCSCRRTTPSRTSMVHSGCSGFCLVCFRPYHKLWTGKLTNQSSRTMSAI